MGVAADQSYLIANGTNQSLSVAIDHMQNYEPQALSLAANGELQIETLAGDAWLGPRQGFFSQFGILAQDHAGSATTGTTAEELLWDPLNHPLRAWPSATWFASSNAVEPFPWLPLEGALAQYDTLIPRVLQNTLENIHYKGLDGILTFGSLPRYWTDSLRTDELDCDDPTPTYDWDNKYWCSTWTDYHNTFMTIPIWAMRSGQTKWLDDLAFPAALRMLYTQIMRCSSSDGWFYCGQAPAGYQAYRGDFNSSHAYMENLIYYYWFTGDQTVISSLTPGAMSMRDYLCPSRPATQIFGPAFRVDRPSNGIACFACWVWLQISVFMRITAPTLVVNLPSITFNKQLWTMVWITASC